MRQTLGPATSCACQHLPKAARHVERTSPSPGVIPAPLVRLARAEMGRNPGALPLARCDWLKHAGLRMLRDGLDNLVSAIDEVGHLLSGRFLLLVVTTHVANVAQQGNVPPLGNIDCAIRFQKFV